MSSHLCKYCGRAFVNSKAMAGHTHTHTHNAEKSARYSAANVKRWSDVEYRKRLLEKIPNAVKNSLKIRQEIWYRKILSVAQKLRFSDQKERLRYSQMFSGAGNPNWNIDRQKQNKRDIFTSRVRSSFKQAKRGIFSGILDHIWPELGYSSQQLKEHIEQQFIGNMGWSNWGEIWQIDHIIPVSRCDETLTPSQVNALSNLRPLHSKDNRSKGRRLDSEWRINNEG